MFFVVVLQNGLDVADCETVSYSETGVTCVDDDGTEGVSIKVENAVVIKEDFCIKVEEAIDMKDDIPTMETEQEVRLMCVCVGGGSSCFRAFMAKKGNSEISLKYSLICVVLCRPYTV